MWHLVRPGVALSIALVAPFLLDLAPNGNGDCWPHKGAQVKICLAPTLVVGHVQGHAFHKTNVSPLQKVSTPNSPRPPSELIAIGGAFAILQRQVASAHFVRTLWLRLDDLQLPFDRWTGRLKTKSLREQNGFGNTSVCLFILRSASPLNSTSPSIY